LAAASASLNVGKYDSFLASPRKKLNFVLLVLALFLSVETKLSSSSEFRLTELFRGVIPSLSLADCLYYISSFDRV